MRTSVGAEMIVKTRYVIACDGASSRTRKSLGIDFLDYNFNEPWIIIDANVPDADMLEDYIIMWCDPKRPGTYVPGPGRHRRWEFMLLDGETAENMCTVEAINGLLAPVVPLEGLEVIRSAVYQFHGLIASRWRDRRILLAGDAAHQTPPFYGQGMCHGIRDVANLMWKLRLVLDHPELNALLDTYQVERQAHVKTIIDASVENGRYICTLDPEVARERDARLRARAGVGQDIASFRSVVPGLVGGLISQIEPAAGQRGEPMWQPRVEIRGAGSGLLDDALGAGFALLYTQALSKTPDLTWFGELGATCARIGGPGLGSDLRQEPDERVIEDLGGTFTAWFKRNNAAAVLVRPDHYIYGLADGPDAADRLLAELHRQFDALSVDQS
jgi:3-(3-hydroxy-phenyl)propionate hydroxylase